MIAKNAMTISGHHRHVDRDDIPLRKSEPAQRARRSIHMSRELAIGEDTAGALFGGPTEGRCVFLRRPDPFVETVMDDVHFAADAPSGPRQTRRGVDDFVVGRRELDAEIAKHRIPEPLGIVDRAPMQLRKIRYAVRRHEATELAGGNNICRRSPREVTMRVQYQALSPQPYT